MGASLCGILIQRVIDTQLHVRLGAHQADQIMERLRQSIEYIKEYPEEVRTVIKECYGAAFQAGFGLCTCLLAAAAFCVFWWKEKKLDR